MSQYQPNAAPGKSFISKINSKFSKMSILHHTEKDGSSEDDTLIHNAFVKFFDDTNQPYPDWLGVKNATNQAGRRVDYLGAEYQPVRANYNLAGSVSSYQPTHTRQSGSQSHSHSHSLSQSQSPTQSQQSLDQPVRPPTYTRRSNSKLQDLYQKLRQTGAPTSGRYTTEQPQVAPGARNAAGLRLRERMMNGPSAKPNWGK